MDVSYFYLNVQSSKNMELKDFDAIRPFEPEELPEVYDRLLADRQFQAVLAYLYPQVPMEAIAQKMHACLSCLDFQKAFLIY